MSFKKDFSGKTVLAIETSTPVCSVALQVNGKQFVRSETGMGIHSEKMFLFIEELFGESGITAAELDAVVLGAGPGSYTGLRIVSSAAKGLLFGRDIGLYSCETLALIAAGIHASKKKHQRVHAVLNARRTHLYHQLFEINADESLTIRLDAGIRSLSEIEALFEKNDVLAGTGIQRLNRNLLQDKEIKTIHDSDAISAKEMLYMLGKSEFSSFCKVEDVQLYEPQYQPV